MRNQTKKKSSTMGGWTLIETMIVVAIVGIFVALAVPMIYVMVREPVVYDCSGVSQEQLFDYETACVAGGNGNCERHAKKRFCAEVGGDSATPGRPN